MTNLNNFPGCSEYKYFQNPARISKIRFSLCFFFYLFFVSWLPNSFEIVFQNEPKKIRKIWIIFVSENIRPLCQLGMSLNKTLSSFEEGKSLLLNVQKSLVITLHLDDWHQPWLNLIQSSILGMDRFSRCQIFLIIPLSIVF